VASKSWQLLWKCTWGEEIRKREKKENKPGFDWKESRVKNIFKKFKNVCNSLIQSFQFNTLSLPVLANNIAIYGGSNNQATDNIYNLKKKYKI
jgi:hypothetical protein